MPDVTHGTKLHFVGRWAEEEARRIAAKVAKRAGAVAEAVARRISIRIVSSIPRARRPGSLMGTILYAEASFADGG